MRGRQSNSRAVKRKRETTRNGASAMAGWEDRASLGLFFVSYRANQVLLCVWTKKRAQEIRARLQRQIPINTSPLLFQRGLGHTPKFKLERSPSFELEGPVLGEEFSLAGRKNLFLFFLNPPFDENAAR